jgi:cobalt-zinc-cadmium efflux system outer membrane protein
MNSERWLATGLSVATLLVSQHGWANPCTTISRENVVACALVASLERKAGEANVQAAAGRVTATDPWFPSNPRVELTGSRWQGDEGTALNWSASLGLELGLAGQRGASRSAAVAERQAATISLSATDRSTTAEALALYFEVLAARDIAQLMQRLEVTSSKLRDGAVAAVERGLIASVEGDVAQASYIDVLRRKVDAERDQQVATAKLASRLGQRNETLSVTGTLLPLATAASIRAGSPSNDSPEARALRAEQQAFDARAEAFRRARVPNPELSAFIQRDGFNEHVLGLGLSFPLPLPQPLGRTYAGEIAENEALARRAGWLHAQQQRQTQLDLQMALADYAAASRIQSAFDTERVARAERALSDLASEVAAGRMAIRDAVLLQQPLLELLHGATESKLQLCLASVEVVRAAGQSFDGGQP